MASAILTSAKRGAYLAIGLYLAVVLFVSIGAQMEHSFEAPIHVAHPASSSNCARKAQWSTGRTRRSRRRMKGYRLWVIASLALMTNGSSLLGIGQASVGAWPGPSRPTTTSHATLRPPPRWGCWPATHRSSAGRIFRAFQVDCLALDMCPALAWMFRRTTPL